VPVSSVACDASRVKGINPGKILGIIAVSQSDFCLKKYPVRARPALYAAGELRAVELYKWTG
jgi:hypothetical protein